MPYATLEDIVETSYTATTSISLNLPAVVNSGDLLIGFLYQNGSDAGAQFTWDAGWTEILDSGGIPKAGVAYRFADGTEDGGTVGITALASQNGVGAVVRWSGTDGVTPPEISTGASGTSTSPDPDGVTASWGSDLNTFLALLIADYDSGSDSVDAVPTNYAHISDGVDASPFEVASTGVFAIATRNLTAASDDPGTFTLAVSQQWKAYTLVIRGSSDSNFDSQGPDSVGNSIGIGNNGPIISFADPLHNGSQVLEGLTNVTAHFYDRTNGEKVVTVMSLSVDSSGLLEDVQSQLFTPSTTYWAILETAQGIGFVREAVSSS